MWTTNYSRYSKYCFCLLLFLKIVCSFVLTSKIIKPGKKQWFSNVYPVINGLQESDNLHFFTDFRDPPLYSVLLSIIFTFWPDFSVVHLHTILTLVFLAEIHLQSYLSVPKGVYERAMELLVPKIP